MKNFFVRYLQPFLPDFVVRHIIRLGIYFVNWNDDKLDLNSEINFAKSIKNLNKATYHTDKANEQHYEFPTDFFKLHLGEKLKYSSCEWDISTKTIEDAEINTIKIYQKNIDLEKLKPGSNILEIGNGWGSLCLTNAKMYPQFKFYSFSNSVTQVKHINETIQKENIKNLITWQQDIDDFIKNGNANIDSILFDRIISIECIEHCRAYDNLFNKISKILNDEGKLFVQVLGRRYHSSLMDKNSWMGRNFLPVK